MIFFRIFIVCANILTGKAGKNKEGVPPRNGHTLKIPFIIGDAYSSTAACAAANRC